MRVPCPCEPCAQRREWVRQWRAKHMPPKRTLCPCESCVNRREWQRRWVAKNKERAEAAAAVSDAELDRRAMRMVLK